MAYINVADAYKYNNDFNKEAYDRISLMVKKGNKEVIKSEAKRNGESTNAYINRAIETLMNSGGAGFGINTTDTENNIYSRLFSQAQLEKISSLLHDGETIEDYIKLAVLDKLKAEEK